MMSTARFRPTKLVITLNPARRKTFAHWTFKHWTVVITILISLAVVTGSQAFGSSINITWGQYNEALAKWNSLQITDYEETVQEWLFSRPPKPPDRWKVVVHVDRTSGTPVESITSYEGLDSTKTTSVPKSWVKLFTVYKLFRDLGNYFRPQTEADIISEAPSGNQRIDIEFDPLMGYPRSQTLTLFDKRSGAVVASASITIESIKVLK